RGRASAVPAIGGRRSSGPGAELHRYRAQQDLARAEGTPVLDLFTRWFRSEEQSKQVAKERLRLVLVQDRVSLTAQEMEALKEDLLAVISKYLEIDESGPDVTLERDGQSVALVATIPIKRTAAERVRG